jgi:RNA polymerase sigma factor (TIGR02999 family)
MKIPLPTGITALLNASSRGDEQAGNQLYTLIYGELRQLAAHHLYREREVFTLQPTALVSEAWIRLHEGEQVVWENRLHFFGAAARLMRNVLVDHARRRKRYKRGDRRLHVTLEDARNIPATQDLELEALDDALKDLERFAPRQHRIVELRFFAGLTNEEIAELLSVAPITVKREWRLAKAWLFRQLHKGENHA